MESYPCDVLVLSLSLSISLSIIVHFILELEILNNWNVLLHMIVLELLIPLILLLYSSLVCEEILEFYFFMEHL